ncbi:hypothetical protein V7D15_05470 [Thermoanaerobacter thermohydrosulfuricus]|nr:MULTISPECIES: hypothetical protein [Thermoanaerobacter]UZQ84007.1 hypothetical protein OEI98_001172 [Thermoanaerobacter sp. RKWS2]
MKELNDKYKEITSKILIIKMKNYYLSKSKEELGSKAFNPLLPFLKF